MQRALTAGAAYFGLVFAAGFLLGTVRVLVVAPRLGEFLAVLVELPLMLGAAWVVCRRLTLAMEVPTKAQARLVMGGVAFLLLMAAEYGLARYAFGRSVAEIFAGYRTAAGALGLAGQALFALIPLVQRPPR